MAEIDIFINAAPVAIDVSAAQGPDSGGAGVSDHGALTGLAEDDHTQYALADGSRGSFATTAQGTKADSALQATVATKTTPIDADTVDLQDSADAGARKLLTFANLWTWVLGKIQGTALAFTSTTRPTSAGTGTPAATSLITRLDAEDSELFNMHRMRRSGFSLGVANGGSATVNSIDGDILASGTAANNRPIAYAYRLVNTNTPASNQAHYVRPVRIATLAQMRHPGSNNTSGKIRFAYGMPVTTVPAGEENALAGNGFGWEVFWDGTDIKIGLFAYASSTYVATDGAGGRESPVSTGLTVAANDSFASVIVGLDAVGTVRLWASFANIGGNLARPSSTPILTLEGGPLDGARYPVTGYPAWILANHSTNAATAQMDMKVMNKLLILD